VVFSWKTSPVAWTKIPFIWTALKTTFHDLDQSEPISCSDWCQTSPNGGHIRPLFLKSKNYRYFGKRIIYTRLIGAFGDHLALKTYWNTVKDYLPRKPCLWLTGWHYIRLNSGLFLRSGAVNSG
jgi:hypothetical protein